MLSIKQKIIERETSKRTSDRFLMLDNDVRSKQISGNQVRKIRSINRLVLRSILSTCNDIPVDHCCVGISTVKLI